MTTILALISEEARRTTLAPALLGLGAEIFFDLRDLPADRTIDIVVNSGPADAIHSVCRDSRYVAGLTTVLSIGPGSPADTVLPDDATPREIALACKLMAEIVSLRSQQSETLRARGQWQDLAFTDPLTGIPNRRAWDEEFFRRGCRPRSAKVSWGLAVLDIDHFKEVNDRYGHATGDHVLKRAAHAIAAGVRVSDFAARLGGDEFGLLLADVESADAACVVERIRRGVATRCSAPAGPNVSASAGFAITYEHDNCETLFERADAALRRAKDSGRDRTVGP